MRGGGDQILQFFRDFRRYLNTRIDREASIKSCIFRGFLWTRKNMGPNLLELHWAKHKSSSVLSQQINCISNPPAAGAPTSFPPTPLPTHAQKTLMSSLLRRNRISTIASHSLHPLENPNHDPNTTPHETTTTTRSSLVRPFSCSIKAILTRFFLILLTLSVLWLCLLALAKPPSRSTTRFFAQEKRTLLRLDESRRRPITNNDDNNIDTGINTDAAIAAGAGGGATINDITLTPFGNVFVAANFFNSENVLIYLLPEILRFVKLLHISKKHNVFVSLQENGSNDRTSVMMLEFEKELGNVLVFGFWFWF